MGIKECDLCEEKIKKNDKHVIIKTISPSIEEEKYYHFACFKKNHEKKVEEKARHIIKNMQNKSQELMSNITGSIGGFQGMEALNGMLGVDLNKEIKVEDITEKINKKSKKKKNGKRKK